MISLMLTMMVIITVASVANDGDGINDTVESDDIDNDVDENDDDADYVFPGCPYLKSIWHTTC